MIVRSLLAPSANVNDTNARERTLLAQAARLSRVEIMKLLIKRGANLYVRDSNGWTPLHHPVHGTTAQSKSQRCFEGFKIAL